MKNISDFIYKVVFNAPETWLFVDGESWRREYQLRDNENIRVVWEHPNIYSLFFNNLLVFKVTHLRKSLDKEEVTILEIDEELFSIFVMSV